MDPEQLAEKAQEYFKRFFVCSLGRWQILMLLPFVLFVVGIAWRSVSLLIIATLPIGLVVLYYAMRLTLLNGKELFWGLFAGLLGFMVVCVVLLGWIFHSSRPWIAENAERIALQDELLQVCLDQRLEATCNTPECRASSHEDAERVCREEWLAGCHTLGTPRLDLATLPRETQQHLDTLCTYFRVR